MLWKRQIPILIVAVIGSITLFGWFINEPSVKVFVEDDATQWYNILASFAAILGALNLIKIQAQKVLYQKPGWGYSMIAVLGTQIDDVKNIIKEDSKAEILQLLDYDSDSLVESIRINTESAIDQKQLTIEEARKLIDQIEISLRNSSYLSE